MTAKKLNIKIIEIWMPTVVKLWFGLYKVTKWTHFEFIGGKQMVDGKPVNEFVTGLIKSKSKNKK